MKVKDLIAILLHQDDNKDVVFEDQDDVMDVNAVVVREKHITLADEADDVCDCDVCNMYSGEIVEVFD